jgi:hypothetical protein
MNIELIKIEPLNPSLAIGTPRPPATPDNCYWALAIEDSGKFYYWGRGVSLPISEEDYELVRANPKLFLGSTSHRLNQRIIFLSNLNK